jgi:hypothetical protein
VHDPFTHVPGDAKQPLGGESHVTFAQGSVTHAPFAQPPAPQSMICDAYVHRPPLQLPTWSYALSCEPLMQTFAGAASHTSGVPVHAPAEHVSATVHALPSSHVASSTNAYWHTPPSQVPVSA